MTRKKRFGEYVCRCKAYNFPHRFGGGKCTGKIIAQNQFENNFPGGECANCMLKNNSEEYPYCEVDRGQESFKECPVYINFIEFNEIR